MSLFRLSLSTALGVCCTSLPQHGRGLQPSPFATVLKTRCGRTTVVRFAPVVSCKGLGCGSQRFSSLYLGSTEQNALSVGGLFMGLNSVFLISCFIAF